MSHEARVLGMNPEGSWLQIQSTFDKSEYKVGGSKYGSRYEWSLNHYSFVTNKEHVKDFLGLTEEKWQEYDDLFLERFDINIDKWVKL